MELRVSEGLVADCWHCEKEVSRPCHEGHGKERPEDSAETAAAHRQSSAFVGVALGSLAFDGVVNYVQQSVHCVGGADGKHRHTKRPDCTKDLRANPGGEDFSDEKQTHANHGAVPGVEGSHPQQHNQQKPSSHAERPHVHAGEKRKHGAPKTTPQIPRRQNDALRAADGLGHSAFVRVNL